MQHAYYITTKQQLEAEIGRRSDSCDRIRDAVDSAVREKYGIESFTGLIDKMGPRKTGRTQGFLARQIPYQNIEGVSVSVLCQLLELDFLIGPFADDTFSTSSLDKVPPLAPHTRMTRLKRDRMTTSITERYEEYGGIPVNKLESTVIRDIPRLYPDLGSVVESRTGELARLTSGNTWDISSFWRMCIKEAKKKPEFVYIGEQHILGEEFPRQVRKVPYTSELEENGEACALRPSAEWYYFLYFCLYMTGETVLMETYSNPRGQVAEAEQLFMRTVDSIRACTGEIPAIVQIQPLSVPMLAINADITPVAMVDIQRLSASLVSQTDIPTLHKSVADLVIGYTALKKWHAFFDFGLKKNAYSNGGQTT